MGARRLGDQLGGLQDGVALRSSVLAGDGGVMNDRGFGAGDELVADP